MSEQLCNQVLLGCELEGQREGSQKGSIPFQWEHRLRLVTSQEPLETSAVKTCHS